MKYRFLFAFPAVVIYIMALLIGSLYALVVPTLSVYLADELHVRPLLIGSFFVCMALTAVFYSQIIAFWYEQFVDRRKLVFIGMLCGAAACFGFAYFRTFTGALLTAISLFSLSVTAAGQMLLLSREYADEHLTQVENRHFNAVVRACVALAWTLGPPLGFLALAQVGFVRHYSAVGFIYGAVAIVALLLLPRRLSPPSQAYAEVTLGQHPRLLLSVLAFALLYAANQAYLISLPLFLEQSLHTNSYRAGLLFGLAAGLEIPVMIFAARFAGRVSLVPLLLCGALAAAVLNFGVWQAMAFWQLCVLQIFKAIAIGCVAGLGISWFQELLPARGEAAAMVYFNCINLGNVGGAIVVAIFAELYDYQAVFGVNFIVSCVAMLLFAVLSRLRR